MAITIGEDGFLTFNIPVNPEQPNFTLPKLQDYINFLNDSELSYSLVNNLGMVTMPDIQGSFLKTDNDKLSILLGGEFNPIVYRGQNNDYPFMPSSQRYELADGRERIRHSIEWIKKNEFLRLIKSSPYYYRSLNFKVFNHNYELNFESVAKLYNCVSDYIDVTRNIMVAYFFAYTYFDKEKRQIAPIQDFENFSPAIYIGNLKKLYKTVPSSIQNTGFQTLLRAKAQQALSLDVSNDRDIIKNTFTKIDLPKNPVIAKNVFKQFNNGQLLLPADYASKCASKIKETRTLQEDLVEEYCNITKTDRNWLRSEYTKFGFSLVNNRWELPEQAKYVMHREIDDYIIPFLNNNFICRGVKTN